MNEETLFHLAVEKLPSERAALLDEACLADAELRGRVERLLAEHERQETFILDTPPAGLDPTVLHPISERPGTVIGPYKLLEQIGEGGFGVVFMAEQARPIRRLVAVKVIKPGMDTRQVIARFEAERQALAMMHHPNIAKVFDAGATESGRPYFVMELVQGVPITEYCNQCNLPTRERLQLFVSVCQAVQHAHQKGVIHRDLKPTNVLVAMQDGGPAPKIIDFGVAKAVNQRLTEQTLITGFAQMLGTPLYMSPEQAELSPLGVDTRSDIYSLGVLLYELLTGATPFDKERLHAASYDELRRIIREEEPPRPSTRISTLAGDLATTVAEQRRTDARRLRQTVRGDLDWIVMKCLDKDRNRRYETASAFVADIQRYLNDEPIEARGPSIVYRVQKFARRHKMGIALAVAFAALAVSTLVIARQRNIADIQRRHAAQLAENTRQHLYATDIKLAYKAWTTGDLGEVLRLLQRNRPAGPQDDLRGFEWYHLWRLVHGDPLVLRGHAGEVYFVTFSPDGTRLATASQDGTVRVWDAAKDEMLLTFSGHTGEVTGVSWSPDGTKLASAGDDRTVRVWDAVDGKELAILRGHTDIVFNAVFSPNGKLLASGGQDDVVKLWDTTNWGELATLRGHAHDVEHLAFSPDGRLLATAGGEDLRPEPPTVKLWNLATRTEKATLLGHRADVFSVAFSPDGRTLASASADRTVKLWDVAAEAELRTLRGHASDVHSVAFSPDGATLASSSRDGTVRLWDVASGRPRWWSVDHAGRVWSVTYTPDGRGLATAGSDRTIKLWDLDASSTRRRLPIDIARSAGVALSFDGKWLATIEYDGRSRNRLGSNGNGTVWDAVSGAEVWSFARNSRFECETPAFSPTSSGLAFHTDGVLHLCDVPSGRTRLSIPEPDRPDFIAVSPGDRFVATAISGRPVKIWDAEIGELHTSLEQHRFLRCIAFSPDGRLLAAGVADDDPHQVSWDAEAGRLVAGPASHGPNSQVFLWDPEAGKLRATLTTPGFCVSCVAFSPDGKTIATIADDATQLWDAQTYTLRATLSGHNRATHWCAFSPDGRTLATGSEDHTVRLVHVATGQELFTLEGHTGPVRHVAFYPDGRRLLSAGTAADGRGEFYIWSAAEDGKQNSFDSTLAGSLRDVRTNEQNERRPL